MKSKTTKVLALSLGIAFAFGAVAAPAVHADTLSDLQAQIAALMAQIAALQGGSVSAGGSFTQDLTVGSTGSQVVALQQMLVSNGYLVMPAGVAYGYFGSATKAAVMRWQAASGVSPASGYFGPISRARANGSAAGGVTTGGTVGSGSGAPAVASCAARNEGTMTVTASPVSNTTVYAGDSNDSILAFKAQANGSDLSLQRIKIDLGTSANIYNKVLSSVSLVDDAGRVVASAALNTSTVVKDADGHYYLTLTGFSSVVPKGTSRVFTIKGNLYSSISSTYTTSYTIQLANSGVRAVDCAGIDVYSPTTGSDVSKSITVSASLSESASMSVSTNSSTPKTQEIVASAGAANDQADKVVLLTFDIRADKSDVNITDLKNFVINRSAGAATASTTYLYEGSGTGGTLLGSASVNVNDADFTNISSNISQGSTKTYTLAADIRSANATQTTISASFAGNTTNVVAVAMDGSTINTVTGSATGNNVLVRNVGPVFSLLGNPTIVRGSTAVNNNTSTSTATATFNLSILASGSDVTFGSLASTTSSTAGGGPLASNGTGAPGASFIVYLNGSANNPVVASSTDFSIPSSGVSTANLTNSFTLAKGQTVNVPITFTFQGNLSTGVGITYGNYAVGLERLNWVTSTTGPAASTYMSGKTEWRTPSIQLP